MDTMTPLIYLSLIFALSELLLALIKRSGKSSSKIRGDKGSVVLIWIAITAGFSAGFIFSEPAGYLNLAVGFAIILSGLIIRWIAIIQLGSYFTVDVAIVKGARLKTDGIYKKIRHPSYMGILLVVAGFLVTMNSLMSLLVFATPVFLAVWYRISVEEKILISEFGSEYLRYKKISKKLVPYIF